MVTEHLKNLLARLSFGLAFVLFSSASLANYADHAGAQQFINKMVSEHGFSESDMRAWLAQAEKKQGILDAIARPAEKTKKWFEYRKIFLGQSRIDQGLAFWAEHEDTLARATATYGVPAEMIVAIIGVETRYGRHKGSYRVIDALSTLGFDYPPRSSFFSKELEQFFLLAREQKQDPLMPTGSYAGAMGYGQFIPSSYRRYAVDFDDDGVVDIWNNPVDAIGSVANYFSVHGWQAEQPVLTRVHIRSSYDSALVNESHKPSFTQKEAAKKGFTAVDKTPETKKLLVTPLMYEGEKGREFWFGYQNFYVITRYNRSRLYARAAWELSREIDQAYKAASAKK